MFNVIANLGNEIKCSKAFTEKFSAIVAVVFIR